MPIYEYKCTACGHVFEAFQRVGDDGSLLRCPACDAEKPGKIFSAFASSGTDRSIGSVGAANCGGNRFG